MARPVARTINLPRFGRETGSSRIHVLVLQWGHLVQQTQVGLPGAPAIPVHITSPLAVGSILVMYSESGFPYSPRSSTGPTHLIIYKEPAPSTPEATNKSTSLSTLTRGPLPRMLAHRLGHKLFALDVVGRMEFWNLIRENGVIAAGEKTRLAWLVGACRMKYFGGSERSKLLGTEDLLEYLCRDTVVFAAVV